MYHAYLTHTHTPPIVWEGYPYDTLRIIIMKKKDIRIISNAPYFSDSSPLSHKLKLLKI